MTTRTSRQIYIDGRKNFFVLEQNLSVLLRENPAETLVEVFLPEDTSELPCMVDAALLYFVSTLLRNGFAVQITFDDITDWLIGEEKFVRDLLHIALVFLAREWEQLIIVDQLRQRLPTRKFLNRIFDEIFVFSDGILAESRGGPSLAIIQADPDFSEAPAFRGASTSWSKFSSAVSLALLRNKKYFAELLPTEDGEFLGVFKNILFFLYELNQNGYEHGRLDERGNTINGIRYFRIRVRDFGSKEQVKNWCGAVSTVEDVLTAPGQPTKFIEVNISDFGIGILKTYCNAKLPTHDGSDRDASAQLLSRILLEDLTSKAGGITREGGGLHQAIDAIRNAQGALCLRTDRFSVYRSFKHDRELSLPSGLVFAELRDLNRYEYVMGTHWTLWIPAV